ncbi:type II toxin-antitoxin system PemK/MazF family toxin [Roseivivax marinus]|uniref:type II toxin-antitoxin system PemK/MazF family toxin n=1 Tax=Roseivivax marinus TaxID=1379903 RepID=UPI00273D23C3|nr:type II toxin-antitoxin system PemK/MazF family toxin [Roseivivax marinus]
MSDDARPPRIKPRIKSAPRPRQVYWCDFPQDAHLPEFWKTRPVLILSPKVALYGVATVVPLSTKPQPDNDLAHDFASPLPNGGRSWAICSHVTTVAVSRLTLVDGKAPRISDEDFQEVLRLVRRTIPTPRS